MNNTGFSSKSIERNNIFLGSYGLPNYRLPQNDIMSPHPDPPPMGEGIKDFSFSQ
jgi:hypothetical protein